VTQAAAFAAAISLQHTLAKLNPGQGTWQRRSSSSRRNTYELDFEINDFPQHARWKITHKETLNQINTVDGVGCHYTGRPRATWQEARPYSGRTQAVPVCVCRPTESSVRKAKQEIKRILEEATAASIAHQGHGQGGGGRYSVV